MERETGLGPETFAAIRCRPWARHAQVCCLARLPTCRRNRRKASKRVDTCPVKQENKQERACCTVWTYGPERPLISERKQALDQGQVETFLKGSFENPPGAAAPKQPLLLAVGPIRALNNDVRGRSFIPRSRFIASIASLLPDIRAKLPLLRN
jgi:hypothetical protein